MKSAPAHGTFARMVTKGQVLERPTVIPVGQVVLEGLSHRGSRRPPLLIIPPRPEDGGGMDHLVAAELAWQVARAEHPVLRFNFRGVGASQGERGGPSELAEDVEAAMTAVVENTGSAQVALAAIGGSAAVALSVADRRPAVGGLCLISPDEAHAEALARLRCPLLVILGQRDLRVPRAAIAAAVTGAGGRLELVEGADARWDRNLPQAGRAVVAWLQHLSGSQHGGIT